MINNANFHKVKSPMFSIIIPYYKSNETIEKTLMSVRWQTLQDYEVIIVDDGSRDNYLTGLQESFDFQLITLQSNQGSAIARTVGAKRAAGNYIALLDADDVWRPNHLEIHKVLWQKMGPNVACIGTNASEFYSEDEIDSLLSGVSHCSLKYADISTINLAIRNPLFNSSTTISKDILESVGFWLYLKLTYAEDYELLGRFSSNGFRLIKCLDDTLLYRVSKDSKSANIQRIFSSRHQVACSILDNSRSYLLRTNLAKVAILYLIFLSNLIAQLRKYDSFTPVDPPIKELRKLSKLTNLLMKQPKIWFSLKTFLRIIPKNLISKFFRKPLVASYKLRQTE